MNRVTSRRRLPGRIALILLSLFLVTCEDTGCNEEPYDATSPAAQILEKKLNVPIVAGDDYVRNNVSFSWVRVNAYDRDGKKTIKCYCDSTRISDVDRDDEKWDYDLELRFRIEAGGKTILDLSRRGDFDGERVMLNELCKGGVAVPDKVIVTKIRVTKTEIPPEPEDPAEPDGE